MHPERIEIPYHGEQFFIDIADGKMVDLNKIFDISGSPKTKAPKEWAKLPTTKNLIKSMNGGKSTIWKSSRGAGGGTWAHWQLALAYAQYLSPELHLAVNQVFKERLEETLDPELGIKRSRERARKTWEACGKGRDWIAARERGIDDRKGYVDTLINHDVKPGAEVGRCTNNIYKGVFGKDKSELEQEIRERNSDLPKRINVRDHAKRSSLAAIGLAEALTAEEIEEFDVRGVKDCAQTSFDKGMSVRTALIDARSKAPPRIAKPQPPSDAAKAGIASLRAALKTS